MELLPVGGLDLPGLTGRQRVVRAADGHGDGEIIGVAQGDAGVDVAELRLHVEQNEGGIAVHV